jgi:predicted Zn-dependent protease
MNKMKKVLFYLLLPAVALTGCKSLNLVSDEEVLQMSNEQYTAFMQTAIKSTNATQSALVQTVGKKIASAAETYLTNNGLSSELSQYSWEFNLVQSSDVNAFCMPGGKIVVYEGILPVTQDEIGLAVVLGHEVSHAVLKHAKQQINTEMQAQLASGLLSTALGGASQTVQTIASTAFGLGTQLGFTLRYSRADELEADKMGLVFMAMAGYDPSKAVSFWQRMAQASSSASDSGIAKYFSTHPTDSERISEIQKFLPTAQQYYRPSGTTTTTTKTTKTVTTTKK